MPNFKKEERSKYATTKTKGRTEQLESDECRNPFQRDCHRIIYSQAFRRLRHKTQVFYFPQNDHVSTRMDHVLFVSSAARTVARSLDLNEDLAEAIGLAHDIGHAPFGHQGEDFINEIIEGIIQEKSSFKKIMPVFQHEIYGLRVVDKLAKLDREKPGLNLTWEVRDGIISHCGEDRKTHKLNWGNRDKNLEQIRRKKEVGNPATPEGCVVRLIDKIAYCGKDIEDAIEGGILKEEQVPANIKQALGNNNGQIIGTFIKDMIENSNLEKGYIALSEEKGNLLSELIKFNGEYIYHSPKAEIYKKQGLQTIRLLFDALLKVIEDSKCFSEFNPEDTKTPNVYKIFYLFVNRDMKGIYTKDAPEELKVLDFIAGMTDSFAVSSFQELFIPQATV